MAPAAWGHAPLRVAIIGCGHVGLVTGACLAAIGHRVICVDRVAEKIRMLEKGRLPIYEPHLAELIQQSRAAGKLTFSNTSGRAARDTEVVFLCVGVPLLDSGEADFSALDSAVQEIARAVKTTKLIVERSTVPVETGKQLKHLLSVYSRSHRTVFRVAANPQFHREGRAVEGFFHPDRILLGVGDDRSERTLRRLYAPILKQSFPCPVHARNCPPRKPPKLLLTNVHSAELIKHASNAFLAVKISYANVLADLCERLGGNVDEVTQAMGIDPRIGSRFLEAGIGFGGPRLPKDLRALCRLAERAGADAGILQAAEDINLRRVDVLFEKAKRSLWVLKDKRIGLLGLAHKVGTDDVSGSPAVELWKRLAAAGALIHAYDPQAMAEARRAHSGIACGADAYEVVKDADAVVIATDWEEFRDLDWQRVHDMMARPLVLDCRNLLSPARMKELGFEYHSVGRPGD